MGTFVLLLKYTLYGTLPFAVAHLFFKSLFGVTLPQVVLWWCKNGGSVEHWVGVLLGAFFAGLLFFVTFMTLVDYAYLGLTGEQQELVYLGHRDKFEGVYMNPEKPADQPLVAHVGDGVNVSFDELLRGEVFIKNRGVDEAGVRIDYFDKWNIVTVVLMMSAALLPLLLCLHALGYPVHLAEYPGSQIQNISQRESVEGMFRLMGLSAAKATFLFFALILAAVYVSSSKITKQGARTYQELPGSVTNRSYISAYVEDVTVVEAERRDFQTDRYETEDTGLRRATFRVDVGVPHDAFISLYYERDDYPQMYDFLAEKSESSESIRLKITEDLNVGFDIESYNLLSVDDE